ncbi:cytochrome c6 PetJ [Alkalinema sp. FACHB-956]|uniref:cytochrome c6 PetJ n=1 Tax=Alkalinema sp. FACHB-956 TaxID=2692768 RepID=UPI001687E440|nr:c-type cytochrome [Alkalinema sp. FACHB-956]MBD2328296.1 c-type cytochrome [Alkalinema sp. FACHB-956]
MLRKLFLGLIAIVATISFALPAYAADTAAGAKVFAANCAACHAGGRNAVNPTKTLQQADLDQYGMASAEAIIKQVTNGKNAMPAFGGKLQPEQIENVAAYVLAQAGNGWAK